MATQVQQVKAPMMDRVRGVGAYLWHLLQMVLAMEIGMMVYHMLVSPLLQRTAYAELTDAYPMIGYWMMVVFMALGMLALMGYHKAGARYCVEMTAAMIAPVAVLTILALCSVIPHRVLYGLGDPVMIAAMAVYMLYRPDGHAHHHAHETAGQACH